MLVGSRGSLVVRYTPAGETMARLLSRPTQPSRHVTYCTATCRLTAPACDWLIASIRTYVRPHWKRPAKEAARKLRNALGTPTPRAFEPERIISPVKAAAQHESQVRSRWHRIIPDCCGSLYVYPKKLLQPPALARPPLDLGCPRPGA
jgi:hypothetical protein